jgi:hypothetical protein
MGSYRYYQKTIWGRYEQNGQEADTAKKYEDEDSSFSINTIIILALVMFTVAPINTPLTRT